MCSLDGLMLTGKPE
ncbi:rCG58487 [Rattus norvegicus]|uniref:RCG58487 n=1 Tax=Rattus norvegicus TaxID=10116 RepID=A6K6X8_RAT|nr:rCG58487 [Rattus norvegicus]